MTEVTSAVLVKVKHIRPFCWSGAKDWFDAHDIDYRRLRVGIPVEELESTGDKLALEVAERARKDRNG